MEYSNQREETIKVARHCPFSVLAYDCEDDLSIDCARREAFRFNYKKAEKILKENLTDKELVHLASEDIDTSALRFCGVWLKAKCPSYCVYKKTGEGKFELKEKK